MRAQISKEIYGAVGSLSQVANEKIKRNIICHIFITQLFHNVDVIVLTNP